MWKRHQVAGVHEKPEEIDGSKNLAVRVVRVNMTDRSRPETGTREHTYGSRTLGRAGHAGMRPGRYGFHRGNPLSIPAIIPPCIQYQLRRAIVPTRNSHLVRELNRRRAILYARDRVADDNDNNNCPVVTNHNARAAVRWERHRHNAVRTRLGERAGGRGHRRSFYTDVRRPENIFIIRTPTR